MKVYDKKTLNKHLSELKIPPIFDEVLKDVRNVCPTAVIAGGALRDLDHAVAFKDIDIFVPTQSTEQALKIYEDLIISLGAPDIKEVNDYSIVPELIKVATFDYYGVPVQVVCFKSTETNIKKFTVQVLKTFDFGINKIAYIGKSKIHYDPDYLYDRLYHYATLSNVRQPYHLVKLVDKYKRMVEKLGPMALQYRRSAFKGGLKKRA
jgi:hypothetical protein